jgi:hypothetical protein
MTAVSEMYSLYLLLSSESYAEDCMEGCAEDCLEALTMLSAISYLGFCLR